MFAPDELIAALSDGGVDYVLIGGLAVVAHGSPRATKDVVIVPAPDAANLTRLAGVLREIDAHNLGTGEFDRTEFPFDPRKGEDLRAGGNFVLATRLGRLDLMQWVPGVPGDLAFEHLTRNAVETSLGGHPVRVCSRDDLIAMKRAASSSAQPEPRDPSNPFARSALRRDLAAADRRCSGHRHGRRASRQHRGDRTDPLVARGRPGRPRADEDACPAARDRARGG